MDRDEKIEAIVDEFLSIQRNGNDIDEEALKRDHPDLMPELVERLKFAALIANSFSYSYTSNSWTSEQVDQLACPHCGNGIALVEEQTVKTSCHVCGKELSLDSENAGAGNDDDSMQFGRYALISELGRGSFGVVYKGIDKELRRTVAIKVPRSGTFSSRQEEARFLREAENVARLRHPGIVQVYDIGRENGIVYIVSEYVDGSTLEDFIENSRLPFETIAQIAVGICDALQHAHDQGIVHRDIKPTNILMDENSRPHLTDFGLARRKEAAITMTRNGQIVGTPAYMSPEQASAEHQHVDFRSDVYSVGTTIYRLLSGQLPFQGSERMLLHQVLNEDPKPICQINDLVPRDLETIALKAMSKAQSARYQSVAELGADLTRWLNGDPIRARPPGVIEHVRKWCKKRPLVSSLIALATVLVLVITLGSTIWATQAARRSKNDSARAEQALAELSLGYVRQGTEASKENTFAESLIFFVESLAADESLGDEIGARTNRVRINQYFRRLPTLLHCFWEAGEIDAFQSVEDSVYLIRDSELKEISIADGSSRQRIPIEKAVSLQLDAEASRCVILGENRESCEVLDLREAETLCLITDTYISDVDLSLDGSHVLTCSADGSAEVWDAGSGVSQKKYSDPRFSINGGKLAHDSSWIVLWRQDRSNAHSSLQFFSLNDQLQETVDLGPVNVSGVELIDHDSVVVSDTGGGIRLFDVRETVSATSVSFDTEPIQKCIAINDGAQLMTLNSKGVTTLRDVRSGNIICQVTHPLATQLYASPDGSLVAVTGEDCPIFLHWSGTGAQAAPAIPHASDVVGLAFANDNRRLFVSESSGIQKVWDLAGTMRAQKILLHDSGLRRTRFSKCGKHAVTTSTSQTAKIWNVESGLQVGTDLKHDAPVMDACFSADGSMVVTGDSRGELRFWNGVTLQRADPFETDLRRRSPITRLESSPVDPELFAVGRRDGTVTIWRRGAIEEIGTFDLASRVHSLRFDAAGRYLQASSETGIVKIWDNKNCQVVETLPHDGSVRSSSFSPDGEFILTSGKFATVWDWKQRKVLWRTKNFSVPNAVFSPGGDYFSTGCEKRGVGVWSTALSGRPEHVFGQHGLTWCDFHPKLPLFVSAGVRGIATQRVSSYDVWDLRLGEAVLPTKTEPGQLYQAQFSPNGDYLLASSSHGLARLWNLDAIDLSVDDLRGLARVLSGRKIDRRFRVVSSEEQARLFDALTLKFPELFMVAERDIEMWVQAKALARVDTGGH